jgi:acyl-CoA thioester hydrolase
MPLNSNLEIRFSDIDQLKHVNNAVYLSYMEQARINYFKAVLDKDVKWSEKGIILAKAEINYLIPLFLEDKVVVETRINRIGTKSFDIEYLIYKQKDEDLILCAKGLTIMVTYDFVKEASINVPQNWVEKIKRFEGLA